MLTVEGLHATVATDHRAHGAEDVHYLILHRKSILWTIGLRHKPNNAFIHMNENKVSPAAQYGLKDSGLPVILPCSVCQDGGPLWQVMSLPIRVLRKRELN